ncbi:hypothetical protein BKA56DRAFT_638190 [Ilyonectria sp. MPI-CAGE-AT-0026]|nr:hypothetical protein BKA56DRAFT_638190 [Ilyonectria sp. MPI-CAGE-AT-0026]
MSQKTKDAKNLERVRDNQRRSRARRREYLIELEHRIQIYELQGIEASAEVQQAARRVSEENRQLRALFNRHGFSDDYIMSCLHSGASTHGEHGQLSQFLPGVPGEASQTLQQTMAPRRPASFDHGVPYPIPPQEGRQASLASLPPAQPVHPGHPFSRTLPSNAHLPPAAPLPSNNPLTANTLSSLDFSFSGSVYLMEDPRWHSYSLTPMSEDSSSALNCTIFMQPFQQPRVPDPGGLGTNPESGPYAPT